MMNLVLENLSSKIKLAVAFAKAGHNSIGQLRKYSQAPYWTHVYRVARKVWNATKDETLTIAALEHDLIEDVAPQDKTGLFTLESIRVIFGLDVARLVEELTDRYTRELYPHLNRRERKVLERGRLAGISNQGKTIKLADLLDNGKDILEQDKSFAVVYLREKIDLLPFLAGANEQLYAEALRLANDMEIELTKLGLWKK